MNEKSKKPLWSGRFEDAPDSLMVRFGASIQFDYRLFRQDIRVNIAWSRALKDIDMLTEEEFTEIEVGLKRVYEEMESGDFKREESLEDIHMAVEARLTDIIGEAGRKIHTGRSRNDQVATDLRLFVMEAVDIICERIRDVQLIIVRRAREHLRLIMPGYTHMQRAQPIRFSHYLLGLFWMLERDRERLSDCRKRADCLPLGSGALAGSAFPVHRQAIAEELGFTRITENSVDAVSDRDFAAELASTLSILLIHLSRYAEDFIIWSGVEFGFLELPEAYATGSSMMPQKKNPDSLELIRGKTGRVFGDLTALLTIQKGLPLTYAKDLQEDKEPLFDAVDTALDCITVFGRVLDGLVLKSEKMADMGDSLIYSTELADYLTRKGMPFREAHRLVGGIVRETVEKGLNLDELPMKVYKRHSELFEEDLYDFLNAKRSVNLKSIDGGTGLAAVEQQIRTAEAIIQ